MAINRPGPIIPQYPTSTGAPVPSINPWALTQRGVTAVPPGDSYTWTSGPLMGYRYYWSNGTLYSPSADRVTNPMGFIQQSGQDPTDFYNQYYNRTGTPPVAGWRPARGVNPPTDTGPIERATWPAKDLPPPFGNVTFPGRPDNPPPPPGGVPGQPDNPYPGRPDNPPPPPPSNPYPGRPDNPPPGTPPSGAVPGRPDNPPPPAPPPTGGGGGQQGPPPIAGLSNYTAKQKEFLQQHPEWQTANVVRVEAKKGSPYIQWLYNTATGEFLTATRGAVKVDALSQGTKDAFAKMPSVGQYITPGQPPPPQPPQPPNPPPTGGGGTGGQSPSWWKPEWDNLKYYRVNDDGSVAVHQWPGSAYASNFEESGFGAARQLFPMQNPPRFNDTGNVTYLADVGAAWADYEQRTKKQRPASWQELKGAPTNYQAGTPTVAGQFQTARDWSQPPPQGWGPEVGPHAKEAQPGQPKPTATTQTGAQPMATTTQPTQTGNTKQQWEDWLQKSMALGQQFGQSAEKFWRELPPSIRGELQRQGISIPNVGQPPPATPPPPAATKPAPAPTATAPTQTPPPAPIAAAIPTAQPAQQTATAAITQPQQPNPWQQLTQLMAYRQAMQQPQQGSQQAMYQQPQPQQNQWAQAMQMAGGQPQQAYQQQQQNVASPLLQQRANLWQMGLMMPNVGQSPFGYGQPSQQGYRQPQQVYQQPQYRQPQYGGGGGYNPWGQQQSPWGQPQMQQQSRATPDIAQMWQQGLQQQQGGGYGFNAGGNQWGQSYQPPQQQGWGMGGNQFGYRQPQQNAYGYGQPQQAYGGGQAQNPLLQQFNPQQAMYQQPQQGNQFGLGYSQQQRVRTTPMRQSMWG